MGDPIHLEKMGRELKCPICLSLLNSAVSLSCNHLFCNACIVKSMKSGSDCPVCKVPYRRREIRAAPHMDNLVSVYKSMELASGFNIFVTQNAQSAKLPGELKEIGGDANCGKENRGDITREDRRGNQGKLKRKVSTTNDMSDLEICDAVTEKLSFPTKKRVQVPKYPFSETSLQPEEATGSDRSVKDGFKNSSQCVKENSVVDETGKPVLSPFFWLRDEDVEKPSQCTNTDQLLDMTPPDVPTFSDIKDSDDENTSPTGEACEQSNVAGLSDIEMFEWTQIPCSPVVFSGPDKIPTKHSNAKIQGSGMSSMNANNNEGASIESDKCVYSTQRTHILNELLPSESSLRTNSNDNPIGSTKSNKRGRRGITLKKCAKKNLDRVCNAPVDSMAASKTTDEAAGNNCSSSSSQKASKGTKTAGFGSLATKTNLKNASSDSVGIRANKSTEIVPNKFPAPSCGKPGGDENLKMKNTRKLRKKINRQCQKNQSIQLKGQKINPSDINMSGEDNATQNQTNEDGNRKASLLSDPVVADQQISVLRHKPCKHKEINSAPVSVRDQELQSRKPRKVSLNNILEDGLADDHRELHGEFSAMETQFPEKVSNVSTKESESTIKCPGSLDARIKDNHVTMGGHCKRNGVAPSYQKTLTDKIQCAFCHSSEESEASGEMVHYSNGISVAADFNDGHKMIHSHRNCAEWAPNVYFEGDNAINLEAEIARSRRITCCCCGLKGAALGCYEKSCRKSFHVPCAKSTPQCRWDSRNFIMLCPLHVSSKLPNENAGSQKRVRKNCIPKGPMHNQSSKLITNAINNFPKWDSRETHKKLVLCCSALTAGEKEIVSEFKRLSGITVLKKWDLSVTHVIASPDENGSCRRTLKVLMGILEGKWILNVEWVRACMTTMRLVPEAQYEITADIHGIRDGPRLGRLRLLSKQPKIFEGFEFYFTGDFIASYRGYIQDLVIAGGGTILHRKPISGSQGSLGSTPSTFIVYSLELPDKCNSTKKNMVLNQRQADAEALANSTGAKAVSNLWVLNSIAACKLQNFAE